ncbi:LuxR C-terminal-related transcriptional regulator [Streptomyces sp. YGL11-2]|uniref:helix-turn-helix transcriptional regulator n=1 Tax=Streptomyces sp. YGL11-2 TaxID=3414028 RepID=UPI003CF2E85E
MDGGVGSLMVGGLGVGKSALLHTALERAERSGASVLRLGDLPGHPRAVPSRRRVVIGIDDIHRADSPALDLAHRLAQDGQALLLAAAPAGSSLPDGIRRLLVGKRIRRLPVAPFDRSGIAAVLASRIGGPVSADTVERFWELTRGNSLTLCELTEHALAEGSLQNVRGSWQWAGLVGVPDGHLADLSDLLLGELGPGERELVNILALAGPLEAGLPLVDELGPAAESLNLRGVVSTERAGLRLVLRLAHPLCEVVVASSLAELTARRLRLRIADALERTGARRLGDAARIARLRIGTGQLPRPARLRTAAADALRAQDFRLAEHLCRTVLATSAAPAPDLSLMLGEALAGQRRHTEAEACFGQLETSGAGPERHTELVRARARNLALGLHRPREAEAFVAEAAVHDRGAPAEAYEQELSLARLLTDRLGEIRPPAGSAPAASASPAAQRTWPVLALARHELGDTEGGRTVLRGCRPFLAGLSAATQLDHRAVMGAIALHAGGEAEATAVLDDMRQHGNDGNPRHRMHAQLLEAQIHRSAGRTAQAVDLLRQAATYRGPAEWLTTKAWRLAQLAGVLAELGEDREAMYLLDEVRVAQEGEPSYPLVSDAVALERALVTAHLGDRVAAARLALEVAERAAAAGRATQALTALHLAARSGAAVRAVAMRAPGPAGPGTAALRAGHIQALAGNDGTALDETSARFESLGLLPLAAEASAQAAEAHRASGNGRGSRLSRARGVELISRCDVALPDWATPDGRREVGTRAELTGREREIVSLAVSQLSNQQIAGRLVLSVRTVENHLYRAYAKLGVTTRAELAHRLGVGTFPSRRIA